MKSQPTLPLLAAAAAHASMQVPLEQPSVGPHVLTTLPASLVLPDLLYYLLWQPNMLSLRYSARHLLNPLRTLANWDVVEAQAWTVVPLLAGLTGVVAYCVLIHLGMRMTRESAEIDVDESAAATGEAGSADVIY